jgi:hypothetical protein
VADHHHSYETFRPKHLCSYAYKRPIDSKDNTDLEEIAQNHQFVVNAPQRQVSQSFLWNEWDFAII